MGRKVQKQDVFLAILFELSPCVQSKKKGKILGDCWKKKKKKKKSQQIFPGNQNKSTDFSNILDI